MWVSLVGTTLTHVTLTNSFIIKISAMGVASGLLTSFDLSRNTVNILEQNRTVVL